MCLYEKQLIKQPVHACQLLSVLQRKVVNLHTLIISVTFLIIFTVLSFLPYTVYVLKAMLSIMFLTYPQSIFYFDMID